MNTVKIESEILGAVESLRGEAVDMLCELVGHASLLGEEASAQEVMARRFGELGLKVDHFEIDEEKIRQHPGYSPSLVKMVRLDPDALSRYPHEFSGGQRQRICIARALAMEPEVLIADEAVSALDVSVQKQVLELLEDIRERLDLSMLFITHDLRVAAKLCDRVAVMKGGKVVEHGTAFDVLSRPQHEYTQALLAAAPGHAMAGAVEVTNESDA